MEGHEFDPAFVVEVWRRIPEPTHTAWRFSPTKALPKDLDVGDRRSSVGG